ncbi:uncharacterized protein LOC127257377 [Andrographis paniculata]|uniref:uncharacterized protein LOC127257377 n=1 Tax=Andrographis paniculata TaxID=175694 RepID=UPI0021E8DA45|nr:uncharacterized protein LOC127257377 [Andrographis paniculata]
MSMEDNKRKKKVALVTGASGFLGSRICGELLRQGYSVKGFDITVLPRSRGHDDVVSPAYSNFELVVGDVTDYASLKKACSGCHVIFHVAAIVESWIPRPSGFMAVNVGGLRNVVRAYKETKTVEKIIYTSSFFALGFTDGHVADETQMHSGKYFCSEYERSKAMADEIALEAAREEGVAMVLLYPGLIYGVGNLTSGNTVANWLVERFNGRLPGYVGQEKAFSFSHVDDVARGHVAAMTKGRLGERYLLSGENASIKDVFDIAAEITHTQKPQFRIPIFVLAVYGWICIFFCKFISQKHPLVTPQAVDISRHQWAYSCEKAKAELDYNPRSLKEGLTEMVPWLKDIGLIKY